MLYRRLNRANADIEQHVDPHRAVPGDDHRVKPHLTHDVVARLGNLGFVAEQIPRLAEQMLHLQPEHFGVTEQAHRHFTLLVIDEAAERSAVGQDGAGPCAGCLGSAVVKKGHRSSEVQAGLGV